MKETLKHSEVLSGLQNKLRRKICNKQNKQKTRK